MRIRSIKPEFWRSDDIAALRIEDRLLYIGLWSYVDDSGVGEDKLAAICADLFAPDMERDAPEVFERVQRGLTELSVRGLVIRYTVQGKRYIAIPTWEKHQRINRPTKSRFPGPEQADDPHEQPKQGCSCKVSEDSVSPHANYPVGTGEQGNRGTGEQGSQADSPSPPTRAGARDDGPSPDHDPQPSPRRTPAESKRGSRLPDDFAITDEMRQWARENAPTCGMTDHAAFVDYWRGVPGARGRKLDWEATWRNWMRREHEKRATATAARASPRPSTTDQRIADIQALKRRPPLEIAS